MSDRNYKSPRHKLLSFFEKSRDSWKDKCKEAKKDLKALKNKLQQVQTSRDKWKSKARELEEELDNLKKNCST